MNIETKPRVTKHHYSVPVNREKIMLERTAMREAIYTFGCYSPNMQFTLDEVCSAFGFDRQSAWTRIDELKRAGRVKTMATTRNRCIVYEISTVK